MSRDDKQAVVAAERVNGKKGIRSALDIGALATLFVALATGVSYLNGRAYHDGYLSYLNLSSSMFPLQGSDAAVLSAVAWVNAIAAFFRDVENKSAIYWLALLGFTLFFIIVFGSISYLGEKTKAKSGEQPVKGKPLSWIRTVLRFGALLISSAYGAVALLLGFAFVLALFISPFFSVGKDHAKRDLDNKFADSPHVMLKSPDSGKESPYRIIECSSLFCALYSPDAIITVPIAKVEWVTSVPIRR